MDSDEKAFGVEAMNFDETVVVWCGAINYDEHEVVVLIELGSLVELLRVFDCERMKLEHIAEDLKVRFAWSIEVEPEKTIVREQPFDRVTIEADLAAAPIVDDVTDRGAAAIRSYAGSIRAAIEIRLRHSAPHQILPYRLPLGSSGSAMSAIG
jgi:hypothetical protein